MTATKDPTVVCSAKLELKAQLVARALSAATGRCFLVERNGSRSWFQIRPQSTGISPHALRCYRHIAAGLAGLLITTGGCYRRT